MIGPEPPPCHEEDPSGSTQGPTYETWTDREYVYHAAAGAQLDEFILQIDRTGAPMYMLQDAGLNVVGLVDQSGDVIRQDTYAPYGEVVATDLFNLSFGHNQAGWKGLFFDRLVANALGSQLTPGGVGLYRARNRTYSPTLGRWLQRDPNATAQPILEAALFNGLAFSDFALRMDVPTLYGDGMNLFQFGRSNPNANGDPLGLFTYGEQLAGVAIRGLLLGAVLGASTAGGALVGGAMSAWRGDGFLAGVGPGATFGFVGGVGFLFGFGVGSAAGLGSLAAAGVGGATGGMAANAAAGGGEAGDGLKAALIGLVISAATEGMLGLLGGWADDAVRAACFEAGTVVAMIDGTALPIEAITVGELVASAPDRAIQVDGPRAIDPAQWRIVRLAVEEAECTANTIELLRPLRWVQNSQLHEGALTHVSIPEMGLRGWARVEAIQPCPTDITRLTDGTVTGTYRTNEADVVAVHLDELAEPIAATPTHPFWSIDREDWAPAGDLLPGETIGTYDGRATVVAVIPRGVTTTVYNLEVYGAHTYFVSDAKTWVHNSYTAVPKAIVRLPGVPPEGANVGYMSPNGTAYLEHFHTNVAKYLHKQGLWQSAYSPGESGWVYGGMNNAGQFMGVLLD